MNDEGSVPFDGLAGTLLLEEGPGGAVELDGAHSRRGLGGAHGQHQATGQRPLTRGLIAPQSAPSQRPVCVISIVSGLPWTCDSTVVRPV